MVMTYLGTGAYAIECKLDGAHLITRKADGATVILEGEAAQAFFNRLCKCVGGDDVSRLCSSYEFNQSEF